MENKNINVIEIGEIEVQEKSIISEIIHDVIDFGATCIAAVITWPLIKASYDFMINCFEYACNMF